MQASLPRWAIALLVVLGVLLIAAVGGVAFLLGRGSAPAPTTTTTTTASAAVTTPAPPATSTPAPPSSTGVPSSSSKPEETSPAASEDGKHATLVKSVEGSPGAYKATLDYVQFFMGKQAWTEAAKRGDTAENDYYVVNDNPKLRTFPVSADVEIVLHPGNGPQYSRTFSMDEFLALLNAGTSRTYGGMTYTLDPRTVSYVTIKDGEVVRIENIWVP